MNWRPMYTYLLSCLYFWVFEWCALICCSLFKLVTSSIATICVFWKSGSTVGHAANKVTNTMVIKVTVTFFNFTGIVLWTTTPERLASWKTIIYDCCTIHFMLKKWCFTLASITSTKDWSEYEYWFEIKFYE